MLQASRNWRSYRAFKALSRERKRIVFYSESGQDWHHFSPVIHCLTQELDEAVVYLTSDPDDPGLHQKNEQLTAFCIGDGLIRTICFQWLEAGVLVMTLVDFGKLQLNRSVNPVTYAFMFHTLVSVHMADHEDSYDDYDAILCAGPHQLREELLKLRPDKIGVENTPRIAQFAAQVYSHRSAHQDLPGTFLQEVFGCQNAPADYSSGGNLFDARSWSWIMAGGHRSYAIIEPDKFIVTYPYGLVEVLDEYYRPAPGLTLDPHRVEDAMSEMRRFYQ